MKLLLDENLEHEVYHRLDNYGHDAIHVEVSDGLSKGASDSDLAAVSLAEERVIVTYDADFRSEFHPGDYYAVLFFESERLSARQVADIIQQISQYYDGDQLNGFMTVGRSWLD